MSIMYATIEKLYLEGRLTEAGLNNAITRGWITDDEKARIMEKMAE